MMMYQVFAVALLVTLAGAELCTKLNCTCITVNTLTEIDCQDKQIKAITSFADLPDNVITIDLSKNEIITIPVLNETDGLKTLKLSHNMINEIVPDAFKSFNYLEHLDLCHNHLSKLESLEGLSGLLSLNLSHNMLRNLPDDMFDQMDGLEELRLTGNPLHYLRYDWFRRLTRVRFLDVSECALNTLPTNVFHDMINLVELDLSRNVFDEVPSVELRSASKLTKLKMNGNQLKVIKEESFKRCAHLEELELSDMGTLKEIKTGAFSGLSVLRVLKISHNPNLKVLDFGAFEGLYSGLEDMWRLERLILRENGLHEIRSPSTTICKIATLDLQGNPWNCDCNLAWIPGCELREELTHDLKCSSPPAKEDKMIRDLDMEDMVCTPDVLDEQQQRVLRIVVVTSGLVGILFCGIIIVIVVKKRKIMEWWYYRKRGSGAVYYVKAKTNPQDSRGDI